MISPRLLAPAFVFLAAASGHAASVLPQNTLQLPPIAKEASRRRRFGLDLGVYRFSSSKTRDRFGSSGVSVSPSYDVERSTLNRRVRVGLDFNVIYQSKNGNRIFFAPVGARGVVGLTRGQTQPYIGGSLNLALTKLRSQQDDVDTNYRLLPGGSALAGVQFKGRAYVEARYFAFDKVRGFDPSGTQFTVGVQF